MSSFLNESRIIWCNSVLQGSHLGSNLDTEISSSLDASEISASSNSAAFLADCLCCWFFTTGTSKRRYCSTCSSSLSTCPTSTSDRSSILSFSEIDVLVSKFWFSLLPEYFCQAPHPIDVFFFGELMLPLLLWGADILAQPHAKHIRMPF